MKILLHYGNKEHVLDVTPKQLFGLRQMLAQRSVALKKQRLLIPDYSILNLDASQKVLTSVGIAVTRNTETTTTVVDFIRML